MTPLHDRAAWLQGGDAHCVQTPADVKRPWRLVLLGPPGVGKGTQARHLFTALGACPLSTGDVFRAAQTRRSTPGSAMATAHAQMDRGELVHDETVLALIAERNRCLHCRGGFMLDGFPRTLAQANALDALLAAENIMLDAVIDYELPLADLTTRISGRRICPRCKSTYHLEAHPPRFAGLCDHCGGDLIQRKDDQPDAVRVRLEAYLDATMPVAEHYRAQGLLVAVDAAAPPLEILAHTLDALALHGLTA